MVEIGRVICWRIVRVLPGIFGRMFGDLYMEER